MVTRTNRWNRLLDHLQQQYGKRISKPSLPSMLFLKSPASAFMYGSTPCHVSVKHRGFWRIKKRSIHLTVTWVPDSTGSSRSNAADTLLISTDSKEKIRFALMKERQVGSADFRSRFHVKTVHACEDSRPARQQLNGNVQHFLLKIVNLGRSDDLSVRLHKRKLSFRKSDIGPDFQNVADFIHQALQIFDLLRLSQSWGVKFLDHDDATVVEDVVCPICTGALSDDLVSCLRCQTPHCRDCWEYNGQCATFACRETRFTVSTGAVRGTVTGKQ